MAVQKKVARKRTTKSVDDDIKVYRCTMCGREETAPEKKFYKLTHSPDHKGNDGYSHICINCIRDEQKRLTNRYGEKTAVMVLCAKLNAPFYRSAYETVRKSQDNFSFGHYMRLMNNKQYAGKTFALTLVAGELEVTKKEAEEEAEEMIESNWSLDERRAKNEVINMMGYDPFEGYAPKLRKKLFSELLGYLDDDELLSDNYKLAQIIQIINNNIQINQYDIAISKLDPNKEIDAIADLNRLKKELVLSNEKIAKENGISVKGRGDQKAGKGTLTGLMRDMREKDLNEIEINFYEQLTSKASRWGSDISVQSMIENIHLDENDIDEIITTQRDIISELQNSNDDLREERRLWKVKENEVDEKIKILEDKIVELGGTLDDLILESGGDQNA